MFLRLSDARYHALKLKIQQVEEDLAQLRTQHERLRGRFYGARGSESPPPEAPPQSPTVRQEKDAILRDFLAGRRHHT